MKKITLSVALLASNLVNAATPVDGWYSSVMGGYTYFSNNVAQNIAGNLYTGAFYIDGYNVGGRIGYQSNPIRYEGEFSYLHGSNNSFLVNQISQTNTKGTTSAEVVMANLYYDFPDMVPCISPFLGIGLGYAHVQANLSSTGPTTPAYFNASDNVFAYQAQAGATYNFSENYALNIAFRFIGSDRAQNLGKVYETYNGTVGIVYRFDEASYK